MFVSSTGQLYISLHVPSSMAPSMSTCTSSSSTCTGSARHIHCRCRTCEASWKVPITKLYSQGASERSESQKSWENIWENHGTMVFKHRGTMAPWSSGEKAMHKYMKKYCNICVSMDRLNLFGEEAGIVERTAQCLLSLQLLSAFSLPLSPVLEVPLVGGGGVASSSLPASWEYRLVLKEKG